MTKYNKITALYSRLSVGDEDRDGGKSNRIQNQDGICQGYFHRSKCSLLNLNCKTKWGNQQRGMKLSCPAIC